MAMQFLLIFVMKSIKTPSYFRKLQNSTKDIIIRMFLFANQMNSYLYQILSSVIILQMT